MDVAADIMLEGLSVGAVLQLFETCDWSYS
jgi:hypothetical protein